MIFQNEVKSDFKKYRISEVDKYNNINASGAIWWPNLELMKVASSGGQILNLYKWSHIQLASGILFSWRDNSS